MAFLVGGANSAADTGYDIDNSIRFNDDDSAYLSWTPSTATNDDKLTFSFWAKRSTPSANHKILTRYDSTDDRFYIGWANNDKIVIYQKVGGVESFNLHTNRLFRDPSAWYHIVVAFDTTQATEADRIKLYVNGTQETSFSTSNYPTQNLDLYYQTATSVLVKIGQYDSSQYYDGYFADMYFIDGTAYDASAFGETDADSGIWKPKKASVTYGTNGFFMEFKQSGTNQDSSGIGADTSGEDNHFAVTNLAATDQTTDSPTNNWCTLNPISEHNDSTFSDGNLTYTGSASAVHQAIGSIGVTQGKWYYEAKRVTGNSAYPFMGVFNADGTMGGYLGDTVDGWSILMEGGDSGEWRNDGTLSGTSVGTFADDDIGMVAIDMDNGKIWFGRNGTWGDSGDPSAGSGEQYSNLTGTIIPAVAIYTGAAISLNFGNPPYAISSSQADDAGYGNFEYDVPAGFYALCTKNLAEFG